MAKPKQHCPRYKKNFLPLSIIASVKLNFIPYQQKILETAIVSLNGINERAGNWPGVWLRINKRYLEVSARVCFSYVLKDSRHVKYLKVRGIAKIISLFRCKEKRSAISRRRKSWNRKAVFRSPVFDNALETTDSCIAEFRTFADFVYRCGEAATSLLYYIITHENAMPFKPDFPFINQAR